MTEQERRFKITKIDKYNSQIAKEEGKIKNKTTGVIVTAIFAIDLLAKTMAFSSPNEASFYIGSVIGGASAVGSLALLKSMITSISKKTILESKVEDLKEETGFDDYENEKSKILRNKLQSYLFEKKI